MLYYVAPIESREYIEKNGILRPIEVKELIEKGLLESKVLGVSFDGIDSSNFPEYVSLLENFSMTKSVAEQICFSRTRRYNDPSFVAIGYEVDDIIKTHEEFLDEMIVKQMNPDSYLSEVLYKGNIPKELIMRCFAVRTF